MHSLDPGPGMHPSFCLASRDGALARIGWGVLGVVDRGGRDRYHRCCGTLPKCWSSGKLGPCSVQGGGTYRMIVGVIVGPVAWPGVARWKATCF